MKMQRSLLPIAFALTVLLFVGCGTPQWLTKGKSQDERIPNGSTVDVTETNGNHIVGEYVGIKTTPFTQYDEEYQQDIEQNVNDSLLPVPGEHIHFFTTLDREKRWDATLIGFDSRYMWFRLPGEKKFSNVYISTITDLYRWNGGHLQRMAFEKLLARDAVPLMQEIDVRSQANQTVVAIPLNNVKQIGIPKSTSPRIAQSIRSKLDDGYSPVSFVLLAGK